MEKIKNSFGGVIFGILLLIGGTVLLWWNEGNNVRNINSINEVEKQVVSVASDNVDSKNEGKLILTSGSLVTEDEKVTDTDFGFGVKTPVFKRYVEIYEWKEESHTEDDRTTYTYSTSWEDHLIDSSSFHEGTHTNPTSVLYDSNSFYADTVNVGSFGLTLDQKKMLNTRVRYQVEAEQELPEGFDIKAGYVTNAADIDKPAVGDLRIAWEYNDWKEATVLAIQKGDSFTDFVSKDGRKINRIFEGEKSINEVLETMRSEDKAMKWIFRAIGAILIIVGYMAIINPLSTLASFVPFLGGIVGGVLNLIAFLIGLIHSLIIIIIAWFRYRPLLAIILLAVVVLAIVGIVTLVKKNKKVKPVEKEA